MSVLLFFLFFFTTSLQGIIPEKVLICGVCKNVEKRLPYTIKIMEEIGSLFEDYRILVYENNSTDKTAEILINWMKSNSKVDAECEILNNLHEKVINQKSDHSLFHPELIALARNCVLMKAQTEPYKDFNYLIWMDMDFKIPPSYEGFIETFSSKKEWDAVLAYGVDKNEKYWDWYAFRDVKYPIGSELLGNHWWYMKKEFKLPKNGDWYPVYSAFGGCGIYKKSSIENCYYSALPTEDLHQLAQKIIKEGLRTSHPQILKYERLNQAVCSLHTIQKPIPNLPKIENPKVGILLPFSNLIWRMNFFVYQYPSVCEHVPFHAAMIARGHSKIFINPRLKFIYGD